MKTKPAVVTRLRGVWLGVQDINESREFYERLGAIFDEQLGAEGVTYATLGGIRLSFEKRTWERFPTASYVLMLDVTDADELCEELSSSGRQVTQEPRNEPWGRRFNVLDPDGHEISFIGPNT